MKSITKAVDLATSREATIDGFSWQAVQKLEKSNTFLKRAKYFDQKAKAKEILGIEDIRKDKILTDFIIAACMLSKKSLNHLNIEAQNEIIERLVNFERLTEVEYIKSLEQRYFLTSGDTLGGMMRNAIGQAAQNKLTETIIARLEAIGKEPKRIKNPSGKTVQITWKDRRIIFDRKPKFIANSIDIIVLKGDSAASGEMENPADYVCCGELKGGIDPAGADEHWKTAKTALARIADAFEVQGLKKPSLVYIGAAIEQAMANQIFALLQDGWLTGAANMNYENQFVEVVEMLIS